MPPLVGDKAAAFGNRRPDVVRMAAWPFIRSNNTLTRAPRGGGHESDTDGEHLCGLPVASVYSTG